MKNRSDSEGIAKLMTRRSKNGANRGSLEAECNGKYLALGEKWSELSILRSQMSRLRYRAGEKMLELVR